MSFKSNNSSQAQETETTNSPKYNALSPTDNIGENKYTEALDWALNNDEIKNIGITGPYGSGKSSVLKAYQQEKEINETKNKSKKNKKKEKLKFLNISLATFKMEDDTTESSKQNNNIQQTIELNILQQLFYREDDCNIPDSRFRKIKKLNKIELILFPVGITIFLFLLIFLIFQDNFVDFLLISKSAYFYEYIRYLTIALLIVDTYLIARKTIRPLCKYTLEKFSPKGLEFQFKKDDGSSLLNHHIDEIIYFFEVTDYNVVIFEDLERFEDPNIFAKLREINTFINNSQRIARNIVFIYAVRDNLFKGNDRVKFFDFVIPIIPIIHYNNSKVKFREVLQGEIENKNLTLQIIDDLSEFVNDMRLLYNITNEFFLYLGNQKKIEDKSKLFSLIFYKNLYPRDFDDLSKLEGDLHKCILEKEKIIEDEQNKLKIEIKNRKVKIEQINNSFINNIRDLRKIYAFKYLEKFGNKTFNTSKEPVEIIPISKLIEDKYFMLLKKDLLELDGKTINRTNDNFLNIDGKISFENGVVNQKGLYYDEREQLIIDIQQNKEKDLLQEIDELQTKIDELPKKKLSAIFSESSNIINNKTKRYYDFIDILIKHGYIDEDFINYISRFHEGTLVN